MLQYEAQQANRSKTKLFTFNKKKNQGTANVSNKETANALCTSKLTKRCYNCADPNHLGKECPHKSKGAKCYLCGEFGHVAANCTKSSKTTNKSTVSTRVDALQAYNDKKTYKTVHILGKEAMAVIDPGSDLHLMRASFYVQMGAPAIRQEIVKFNGIGSTERNTLGRFTAEVQVDDLGIVLDIDVVPDHYTGHDIILGGELSDFAEVRIHRRKATLTKVDKDSIEATAEVLKSENSNWSEVLCIQVQHDVEAEKQDKTISLEHVTNTTMRKQIRSMVNDYRPRKVKDSGVMMQLVLKDEILVHQNPRRLAAEQRRVVQEIVDNWIAEGIVQPSNSDYASPIVLTKKKNGDPRLCVDYRMLNKKVIRDRYPLPLMEDQLDKLSEARVYCVLDLKDGFFHVSIDKGSRRYTSFVTPDGQFEFLKAPFSDCATLRRYFSDILKLYSGN